MMCPNASIAATTTKIFSIFKIKLYSKIKNLGFLKSLNTMVLIYSNNI